LSERLRELSFVLIGATLLTVIMTWPLAPRLRSVGRVDNGDGQLSIWNVAWVARTLVVDPRHVFDANIFYPHRHTLAYSENNLGAGIIAVPVYWATRNPFAAHNFAVLVAFVLAATGTYYLVRHLNSAHGREDPAAAALSAVCFAFTPFVFAHSAHIQLLMTGGLPFTMWMFHRLTARVSLGRGAALGAVMAATAIACGYYGVFVVLMVGYAAIVVATARGWWGSAKYWSALGAGAIVSILLVLPAFVPYWQLQREQGFRRDLDDARQFSANWSDFLASASNLHAWMLPHLPPWVDVSFPGFVALVFGVAGVWVARTWPRRELLAIYGGLAVLAFWAAFGPAGGLYSVLYKTVPLFAWLRAPSRFGLIVAFALAVLTGMSASQFARRFARPAAILSVLALVASVELRTTSNQRDVPAFDPVYRTLATLPRGPVIELPFYYLRGMFPLHTSYMLSSTVHWMPLVNGYSDYIPQDFLDNVMTLAPFPTPPAMKLLEPLKVRYAVFHMYGYNDSNRRDTEVRLKALESCFRPLYISDTTRLYEIVAYPR
jgi:hypothetical protein